MLRFIHRADIKKLLSIISLCLFSTTGVLSAAGDESAPPRPVFVAETGEIDQKLPYLTLNWKIPDEAEPAPDARFELESAPSGDFLEPISRVRGPDMGSFISGLPEGDYFFRVRSLSEGGEASAWSDPLHVNIQYDSLTQAFVLFGIGAVVSIATIALVVVGDRRTRLEDANS